MHNILICDDDKIIGELIGTYLKEQGYQTVVVSDSRIAKDCVQYEKYSVIITDFCMPFVNGEELIRAVRKSHSNSTCNIILCSSLERDDYWCESMKGVTCYKKPINFSRLSKEIRRMLAA